MASDRTIGTVFVAVVPSTKGFSRAAQAQLKKEAKAVSTAFGNALDKEMARRGGVIGQGLSATARAQARRQAAALAKDADAVRKAEAAAQAVSDKKSLESHKANLKAKAAADALAAKEKAAADKAAQRDREKALDRDYKEKKDALDRQHQLDRDATRRKQQLEDRTRRESLANDRAAAKAREKLAATTNARVAKAAAAGAAGAGGAGSRVDLMESLLGSDDNMARVLGRKMSNAGRRLSFSGSGAAILGGFFAVKWAAEFESAISRAASVVTTKGGEAIFGDEEKVRRMQRLAKQVSLDNPFTNIDVAEAMGALGRAGLDYQQVIGGIAPVTDLAIAAQLDLATTGELVAASINTFGLKADDIPRIADSIAKAANISNASVADLALSLTYTGANAAGLGLTVEETTAMLAALGDKGIVASKAGTQLRSALGSLITTVGTHEEALKAENVQLVDREGNLKSLPKIAHEFATATRDMGQAEREAFLNTVFGKYGGTMGRVFSEGAGYIRKYIKEIKGADGAAKAFADRALGPMQLALLELKGSVENFGVRLGKTLAPTIINIADALKGLFDSLAKADPTTLKLIGVGMFALAAAGPLLWAVGGTVAALGAISGGLASLKTAGGLSTLMKLVGLGKTANVSALTRLKAAFNPVPDDIAKATGTLGRYKNAPSVLAGPVASVKDLWGGARGLAKSGASAGRTAASAAFKGFASLAKGQAWAALGLGIGERFFGGWSAASESAAADMQEKFGSELLGRAQVGRDIFSDMFGDVSVLATAGQMLGSILNLIEDMVGLAMDISPLGAVITALGDLMGGSAGGSGGGVVNWFVTITQLVNRLRIEIMETAAQFKDFWAGFLEMLPGDNFRDTVDQLRSDANKLRADAGNLEEENIVLELKAEFDAKSPEIQAKVATAIEKIRRQVADLPKNQRITAALELAASIDQPAVRKFVEGAFQHGKAWKRAFETGLEGEGLAIDPKTDKSKKNIQDSLNKGEPVKLNVKAVIDDALTKVKELRNKVHNVARGDKSVKVKTNVVGEKQVDNLKSAISKVHGKDAKITAPGAAKAAESVKSVNTQLGKMPANKKTDVAAEGAVEAETQVMNLITQLNAIPTSKTVTVNVVANTASARAAIESIGQPPGEPEGRLAEAFGPAPMAAEGGGPEAPVVAPLAGGGSGGGGGGGTSKGSSGLQTIITRIKDFAKELKHLGERDIRKGVESIRSAINNQKWGDDAQRQLDNQLGGLQEDAQRVRDRLKEIRDQVITDVSAGARDPRWAGRDSSADSLTDAWRSLMDTRILAMEKVNNEQRRRMGKVVKAYRDDWKAYTKELANIEEAKVFRDSVKQMASTSVDMSRAVSAGTMETLLTRQVANLQTAREGIVKLAKKGVPPTLLRQIMEQDPQTAARWVTRLLGSADTDLQAMIVQWNAYQSEAGRLASVGTQIGFGTPADFGKSFEEGLLSREKQLRKFFNRMGTAIADSMEYALGFNKDDFKKSPAARRLEREARQRRQARNQGQGIGGSRQQQQGDRDGVRQTNHIEVKLDSKASQSDKELAKMIGREVSWQLKRAGR